LKILVVFGSDSDQAVYSKFNHIAKITICSAHRTPELLDEILKEPYDLIIAGAGLAAHLPGVIASKTTTPIVGVPVNSNFQGLDSLLSILQMPPGIPVLTTAIDAENFDERILQPYKRINIIGDVDSKPVKKAIEILKEFNIPYDRSSHSQENVINLHFTALEEQQETKHFSINIPIKENSTAEDSLILLKKIRSGFWVGLNRGENAALAAIQLLKTHDEEIKRYKQKMAEKIYQLQDNTLKETDLNLGELYRGKVRDCYSKDGKITIITTDRISAFDQVLGTIPFKGQVLTQLAQFWFEQTNDIITNHLISSPDPNVMIVKRCQPLPIEIIVRGYLAGSAWRDYQKGNPVSGIILPEGMKKNQKFPTPFITPSTKEEYGGHDRPISREEILQKGIISSELYQQVEIAALQLFQRGTDITAQQGLILVDTKYEFGLYHNQLVLIDEIHTPDSSRFWEAASYETAFNNNDDPQQLSKEFLREWLMEQGFMGTGVPPKLSEEIKQKTSKIYIDAYERITGQTFIKDESNILERIKNNLQPLEAVSAKSQTPRVADEVQPNFSNFDAINPLDFRYYGNNKEIYNELHPYLSERATIAYKLRVEAALVRALANRNFCTAKIADEIETATKQVTAEEVYAREKLIHHDIRALVNAIKEKVSEEARPYVHLTATSYDIVDTANALRYKQTTENCLLPALEEFIATLKQLALSEKATLQVGRTHGQHAVPITFGFTIAEYVDRLTQRVTALIQAKDNLRGKFSGAVGAYNASSLFFNDPQEFEKELLNLLNLKPALFSTQIVQSEYLLDLTHALTSTFGILANLSDDMRNLQRSEIAEVGELFTEQQVGSSTMPHKRNPINFENVKSLWKEFMPRILTNYMDQISDHQRDLTNSASQRFIPELFASLYISLKKLNKTMQKLAVDHENVNKNFQINANMLVAEPLYLLLASKGHPEAHEFVRKLTIEAQQSNMPLNQLFLNSEEAQPYLQQFNEKQKAIIQHPENYTGLAEKITEDICR